MSEPAAPSSQQSPGISRVLNRVARELRLTEGSAQLAELGDRLAALWNTPINEDELVNALLAAWADRPSP